jgi:hypothetical protein
MAYLPQFPASTRPCDRRVLSLRGTCIAPRASIACRVRASNGYFPSWLDQYDHTGPQTTALASLAGNQTFGAGTLIGLIYEATNTVANAANQKYPSIDVTLAFTDGSSVTVTIYAPDPVFNNSGPRILTPAPAADSGVAVQQTLGLYWGMQGSDRAVASGAGRVRIAEAVISAASLQAKATPFNPVGKTLASISFGNPISHTSVANMDAGITNPKSSGFLVYAATLRDAVPAPCAVDFDGNGTLQVADIFAFLNAWFAGNSQANFNGMNGLQVADIFAFLNAWFAGC